MESSLDVDRTVKEVDWISPGTKKGLEELSNFCNKRLRIYADKRNDPNLKALSNLSPWLNFGKSLKSSKKNCINLNILELILGQISAQRCVLEVKEFKSKHSKGVDAYIEECVIRRELSDNFCLYNPKYDTIKGAAGWAQTSLDVHR